jgi:NADH dehydrogenase [ubiquinone] 1 alpha subcomplex assembly factor 7
LPVGAAGDFTTSPEISQVFGEVIGAWLIDCWRRLGRPDPVRLVELGPGRGTLMADILRVGRTSPEWLRAIDIHLVEINPDLRRHQAQVLADRRPRWHESFQSIPDGPILLVANEFLDALPIRQLVRHGDVWRERMVGVTADGDFTFVAGPSPSPLAALIPAVEQLEGSVFELPLTAIGVVTDLARRIVTQAGAALLIDYGRETSAVGDTLQGVARHASRSALTDPGEIDLSAHVDFALLARAAREAGAVIAGPIAQREFLIRCGIDARTESLKAAATPDQSIAIDEGVRRLTDPLGMGCLFKALAIGSPGQIG